MMIVLLLFYVDQCRDHCAKMSARCTHAAAEALAQTAKLRALMMRVHVRRLWNPQCQARHLS
jgi:hypothetical protein